MKKLISHALITHLLLLLSVPVLFTACVKDKQVRRVLDREHSPFSALRDRVAKEDKIITNRNLLIRTLYQIVDQSSPVQNRESLQEDLIFKEVLDTFFARFPHVDQRQLNAVGHTKYDKRALEIALACGQDNPAIDLLMQHGAAPLMGDRSDLNMVNVAISQNQIPFLKHLLELDSDCIIEASRHHRILYIALETRNADTLRFIDQFLPPSAYRQSVGNYSMLNLACLFGNLDCVRFVLKKVGPGGLHAPYSPLHLACSEVGSQQSVEIVNYLLAQGADVHAMLPEMGSTPLFSLLFSPPYRDYFDDEGNPVAKLPIDDAVGLLLHAGADPHARMTATLLSTNSSNTLTGTTSAHGEMERSLLDFVQYLETQITPPLRRQVADQIKKAAALAPILEAVALSKNDAPNPYPSQSVTSSRGRLIQLLFKSVEASLPIERALQTDQVLRDRIIDLIQKGASIHQCDDRGFSPLQLALHYPRDNQLVSYLIQAGATDIPAPATSKLLCDIRKGCVAPVKEALTASPHAILLAERSHPMASALQLAARSGSLEMLQLVEKYSTILAYDEVSTANGFSILSAAILSGDLDCVKHAYQKQAQRVSSRICDNTGLSPLQTSIYLTGDHFNDAITYHLLEQDAQRSEFLGLSANAFTFTPDIHMWQSVLFYTALNETKDPHVRQKLDALKSYLLKMEESKSATQSVDRLGKRFSDY